MINKGACCATRKFFRPALEGFKTFRLCVHALRICNRAYSDQLLRRNQISHSLCHGVTRELLLASIHRITVFLRRGLFFSAIQFARDAELYSRAFELIMLGLLDSLFVIG